VFEESAAVHPSVGFMRRYLASHFAHNSSRLFGIIRKSRKVQKEESEAKS
jgi:hypothetical protein